MHGWPKNLWETSTTMSYVGHVVFDDAGQDAEVAAATGGDAAARWRAIEACRDYLRLVVRRGRWSNSAAQIGTSDLVQKTILDGWRDFSRFQGQTPGQLRAWLTAILVHASLNARRRPGRRFMESAGQLANVADSASSPSQAARKKDSQEALQDALGGLSGRYREVVHLRLWDQLSFAQIGDKLSITEDAARMIYGRAIAKLRESLRPAYDSR
jgi:RNA polymerase sigma-70 factor, ECF subfamily